MGQHLLLLAVILFFATASAQYGYYGSYYPYYTYSYGYPSYTYNYYGGGGNGYGMGRCIRSVVFFCL